MTTTIDRAFVRMFSDEVHEAYQRRGSKLRNAVRVQSVTDASTVTFQKVGTGTASTKGRNALVPVMDINHTNITATLVDYYAGDWIDRLDELKTNIDERQVIVRAGAYALGRRSDELILASLADLTTSTTITTATKAGFRNGILTALETLNGNDVPDDGDRWAIVTPRFWSWLMLVDEFCSADYLGDAELPYKAGRFFQVRHWLGVNWMQHSGVAGKGTAASSNLLYHKFSAGHAIGQEVKSDITWHGDRQAHFCNNSMSQAAVMIDSAGGIKMLLNETVELAAS